MVYNSGYFAGLKVQIFDFLLHDIFPATFHPVILKKDIQTLEFACYFTEKRDLSPGDYLICDFLPFGNDFYRGL